LGSLDILLQISRRDLKKDLRRELKKILSVVCMVALVYVSGTKYWLAGVYLY
jgi:hypothetical protein